MCRVTLARAAIRYLPAVLRKTVIAVSVLAVCGAALNATPALATTDTPDCTANAHVCTYTLPFLADTYRLDLPTGVDRITVTARGASSGGGRNFNDAGNQPGAQGATVQGTFAGMGGSMLYASTGGVGATTDGGYHGGGNGLAQNGWASGGGGGSSDVRVGGTGNAMRLIVAGGAGGASGSDYGDPNGPGKGAGCWEGDPTSAECGFQATGSDGTDGYPWGGYTTLFGGGGGGYRGGGANWSGSSWVDPDRLVSGTDVFTAGLNGDQYPPVQNGRVVISYSLTPDAPTGVSAAATGSSSVRVMWTAPVHTGGLPITYTATATGGRSCTTTSTSCQITGLTASTSYMVSVTAANSDSRSDASSGDGAMTSAEMTQSMITPAQSAMLATMPAALTVPSGTPISRTALLNAAGLHASHGAKVSYHVAGAKMGGMKSRGAGLKGVKPGSYLVTITVTSPKGKKIAKAIEIAIT